MTVGLPRHNAVARGLLFGKVVSKVARECGTNITPIKDSGVVPFIPDLHRVIRELSSLNPKLEFSLTLQ